VLWIYWRSNNVNIYKEQKVVTFNEDYYANGARQTIEARLREHAATYGEELELGV
jgi:hypothetical protein